MSEEERKGRRIRRKGDGWRRYVEKKRRREGGGKYKTKRERERWKGS